MIEFNDKPVTAGAIDRTDRIVVESDLKVLSEDHLYGWDQARDDPALMSPEEQHTLIENRPSNSPGMDKLPGPDSYNDIN